jgi:hypothetical protein
VHENCSFALSGLAHFQFATHGLRHGLHSCAASRRKPWMSFHYNNEDLVLTHALKPWKNAKNSSQRLKRGATQNLVFQQTAKQNKGRPCPQTT